MPWIKFKLIERPYYDKNGNLLGRSLHKDEPGIDKIYGGGKVYPEISEDKIIERYEKNGEWLILVDMSDQEVSNIIAKEEVKSYKASPNILKFYNTKDFGAQSLTEQEAETTKEVVFGILPIIEESGVTE